MQSLIKAFYKRLVQKRIMTLFSADQFDFG